MVHPPVSVARDFIDYPYFSDLGAVQLAAVLRERGWEVALVDAFALDGSGLAWREDGRAHLGASVEETAAAARAAGPWDAAVVAYTPFHRPPARDDVLGALLAALRRDAGGAPILLADGYQSGQHYVEADGAAVLGAYPEVDTWVRYEAEVTVPALLDEIAAGGRPRGVHRGANPALDALPLPAWDLVDLAAYDRFRARVVAGLGRGRWAFPIDGRTLPLVTSRGCPYTCVHCSSNPDRDGGPKTQRRYAPERLRAYLRALVREHGATRLEALDELINVNERHFDAFLDEVVALGVKFDVPNGMRADYLERRHFEAMRGRVTTVSVSAESGVQRVVTEVVKKRLDLASIVAAAEHAHAAGVPLMVHYMIGLPGETAAEINGTLAFALDLWDRFGAWPAVQYATPLPGTELARGRSLPIVDDWGPRFQTAPSQPDAAVPAEALRRFQATFARRLAASMGPRRVVVNVNHACNNRCRFCAVVTGTSPQADGARVREALIAERRRGAVAVELDGGEPTLDPDLVPLVRFARQIGYRQIGLTTNGRMCAYEAYARRLVTSGLTTLRFSLHGPEAETHGREVGVPEAFEQTVQGIRHAVALAPAGLEIGLNVTVTRGNVERLGEIAGLAHEWGLRRLDLLAVAPFGPETRRVAPEPEAVARAAAAVIDAWHDRLTVRVHQLPFCYLPGREAHVEGDATRLRAHVVVVDGEGIDVGGWLAERRVRRPECAPCPHAAFCGGFWQEDGVPEPPWQIRRRDAAGGAASHAR